MTTEVRPWGNFTVIFDSDECKVKRLQINPGHGISYQYHYKRREEWTIVSGSGTVCLDGRDISVSTGDHITILPLQKHTVNCGKSDPLIIIEVQTGTYFGEDDIVRLSDRYGRV
jgi:mannose-6-phosphate isomerase